MEHPMSPHSLRLSHAYLLLACLAVSPAFAQASASMAAGGLSGTAEAGPSEHPADHNDRIARGPRTDDTRNCDTRGVTVHSANGSSSASARVSTSPGGSAAVAGGGSPGSKAEFFGCGHDRSTTR
jgi:hypothetical protein